MADFFFFFWEFSEISLIALAFTANVLNPWGNNRNFTFDYTQDTILYISRAHGEIFFMRKMTKFQKMPLLLLPMSQKYGGNSGNFPNWNTENMYCHTQMRGKGEISIMAKAFATILPIYLACLEISQTY